MKLFSAIAPLLLAFLPGAALPAPAAPVPPLYQYQPERVYVVSVSIPLPAGKEWQELAREPWFASNHPLQMEFSLIGIDFRKADIPRFLSPGLLLGGMSKGFPGISRRVAVGFDPEQTENAIRDGLERREARLSAGGARTSSGVIGMRSLTREGEYDWYLPMQTNEISVLQYEAVMNPGAPPDLSPDQLMQPKTNISRAEAERFIKRLNGLKLLPQGTAAPHWSIRRAAEKQGKPMEIVLGRNFSFGLPTSAEWEYAARGGELSGEHYGQDYPLAQFEELEDACRYEHCRGAGGAGGHSTIPTYITQHPNCLGLYNMLGNAMEWVSDEGLPHGAYFRGDPRLREPVGSVSPASTGGELESDAGAENVGFRLVIRSQLRSGMLHKVFGIDMNQEKEAEAALAKLLAAAPAPVPAATEPNTESGNEDDIPVPVPPVVLPEEEEEEPPPPPPAPRSRNLSQQHDRIRNVLAGSSAGYEDDVPAPVPPVVLPEEEETDEYGRTPLMIAAEAGDARRVQHLIHAGAKVHLQDDYGNTALHYAAYGNHNAAIEVLLEAGADVQQCNAEGWTALHRAMVGGNARTVQLLLDAGCNVHAVSDGGYTALHIAALTGQVEAVRLLINAKADVHATACGGNTALHIVAESPYAYDEQAVDIAYMLLARGAWVNLLRNDGKTPLQLAREQGKSTLFHVLIGHDAQ